MTTIELATLAFRALSPAFLVQPILLARSNSRTFQATRCDGQGVATIKVSYR